MNQNGIIRMRCHLHSAQELRFSEVVVLQITSYKMRCLSFSGWITLVQTLWMIMQSRT